MDRKSYMMELRKKLNRLPKAEREEALLYYTEYFDDAGPEGENEVIEELGPADELAAQILKEVAIRRLDEPDKAAKKGISTIWIVILALFAAPIGLPLLLTVVFLGLAAVIVVLAIFFALLVTGGSLLAGGVAGIFVGIYFLVVHTADGLAIFGSSLMMTGTGMLFLLGGILCCRAIMRAFSRMVKRLLTGGKKHE